MILICKYSSEREREREREKRFVHVDLQPHTTYFVTPCVAFMYGICKPYVIYKDKMNIVCLLSI